jgi:type IV pilus assembly protein PilB
MVAEPGAIAETIDRYHRVDSELAELSSVITSEAQQAQSTTALTDENVSDSDDEAPIIRFVNLLISQAIMDHASDIHIEPQRDGLAVRYRIDGVLHEMQRASRSMIAGVISRLKIMAGMDIAERRKPQDGRISVAQAGRSVDLRVATLPTVWGEKVVMRILDSEGSHISIDDLNLSPRNLEVFRSSFNKPHGMVLVTGPTGSGKSTTLYSVVEEVARPEVNVITVEDPVEYRMNGVNQVQVNVKAGLTFASALRSILRSDPDIVLIGEIRDRETAQIAIEASLTGHLVLSTLHTNDAPSAVTRLVEMGVEPFLVGSAMECVVAQRLARRLCPHCREAYQPTRDELEGLRFPLPQGNPMPTFWRPRGCQKCSGTGYSGRIAIHEVMQVDTGIERLAVADAPASDIAACALQEGMVSLRDDGWAKAEQGLTSVDEVLRVTA